MRCFWTQIKNNVYLIFTISMCIILMIPGVSMFYIWRVSTQNLQANMEENNRIALKKGGEYLEESTERISNTIESLIRSDEIVHFLLTKENFSASPEFYKARDAANVVQNYYWPLSFNYCIDILIYNGNNDSVVSNFVPYSASPYFYGNILYYESMNEEQFKNTILNNSGKHFYLGSRKLFYNNKEYQAITLVQPIFLSGRRSAIIALIDAQKLAEIFSGVNVPNGAIYVEDSEGNLITALCENSENLNKIRSHPEEMLLSRYSCQNTDWQIISAVPRNYFPEKSRSIQHIALLSILLSIFFSILLTFIFTYSNTQPLRDIQSMIYRDKHTPLRFDFLKRDVSTIVKTNDSLQQILEQQVSLLRSDLIRKIIRGEISEKNLVEEMAFHYHLRLDTDSFMVAILQITNTTYDHLQLERLTEENVLIKTILSSMYGPIIYMYNEKDNEIVLLIGQTMESSFSLEDPSLFSPLLERLSQEKIPVRIAAGSSKKELSMVYESYTEAAETLKASSFAPGNTVFYNDTSFAKTSGFYYPIDIESNLIRSIHYGNQDKIEKIIHMLYENNFEKRQITSDAAKMLLDNLFFTVLKLDEQINFYSVYKQDFDRIKSIPDSKSCFQELSQILVSLSASYYKDAPRSLSECIMQYLEKNYGNSCLTIEETARHFSMTAPAMYNYFRSTWGKTFASMLEEIRLTHSIELLRKTDLTIEQIAEQTGYNSSHSYRRAFKRLYQITPSEYKDRQMN